MRDYKPRKLKGTIKPARKGRSKAENKKHTKEATKLASDAWIFSDKLPYLFRKENKEYQKKYRESIKVEGKEVRV